MTSSACNTFSYQTTCGDLPINCIIHFAFPDKYMYVEKPATKSRQEALDSLAPFMNSWNHTSGLLSDTGNLTNMKAAWSSIAAVCVKDSNGSDFLLDTLLRETLFSSFLELRPKKNKSTKLPVQTACLNMFVYTLSQFT